MTALPHGGAYGEPPLAHGEQVHPRNIDMYTDKDIDR